MGFTCLAYGLGCFNTGYYLVRWRLGRDLRAEGSGSTGARNVGRLLGRWGFFLTALGDVLKGILAVGVPRLAGASPLVLALCVLAATLGHTHPAQLGFRGGKGVATALAGLLVVDPWYVLGWWTVVGLAWLGTRRTVLASLLGFLFVLPMSWALRAPAGQQVVLACMVALILVAHRKNIRSLLQGRSGDGA